MGLRECKTASADSPVSSLLWLFDSDIDLIWGIWPEAGERMTSLLVAYDNCLNFHVSKVYQLEPSRFSRYLG